MVHDAAQVVCARDLLTRQELEVLHVVAQVQIVDREVDQCGELAPSIADSLESLELDEEYGR